MSAEWPAYWHEFPEIPARTTFIHSHVMTTDGVRLHVCEPRRPGKECIIVLPAPMTPQLIMVPMMSGLCRIMPVMSWEPRGMRWVAANLEAEQLSISRYAQDIEEVVAAKKVESVHLVTWCAGVDVAGEVVARRRVNTKSVAVIAPALPVGPIQKGRTPVYRELFTPLFVELAEASEARRTAIFRKLQLLLQLRTPVAADRAILQRLTDMSFMSKEDVLRYALAWKAFYGGTSIERRLELFRQLLRSLPSHVVLFRDDEVAGCPVEIVGDPGGLTTVDLQASGGHSAPFLCPEVVTASLTRFYQSHGLPRPAAFM